MASLRSVDSSPAWASGRALVAPALVPVVAVLLALATWQVPGMSPTVGIDSSWQIGLHLAAVQGLDFGRQVVFTNGPLGFLAYPLAVTAATGLASFVYAAVAQLALAFVAFRVASRTHGRLVGLVAAALVLALPLLLSDFVVYLALFGAVWILESDDPPRALWLVPLGGALAAFELLVKLNGGLLVLALFVLTAWRLPPCRLLSEAVLLASFAVFLVVFWVASRNSIGALPTWLWRSRDVVSGYTTAMAADSHTRLRSYVFGAAILVCGGALLAFHLRRFRASRARAAALALAVCLFVFAYGKEGFVRHDAHDLFFFSAIGIALLAVGWRGRERVGALALLAATVGAVVFAPGTDRGAVWPSLDRARDAVRETQDLGRLSEQATDARRVAREYLAVPPSMVRRMRGHSVDVVPYETVAVWAYGLEWQPEPLLQWYMAYDGTLDRLNAAAVGKHGADMVLRQWTTAVDAKEPDFEAPATYVTLVCHYRQLAARAGWQLLGRTGNRCGRPRVLRDVRARAGETIAIPPAPHADDLVVASVRLGASASYRLESILFKPVRLPHVELDGLDARFIQETAADPLVLRLPRSAGFAGAFGGGGLSFHTIGFRHVASPVEIRFEAIPVRGPQVRAFAPLRGRLDGRTVSVAGRRYPIVPGAVAGFVGPVQSASGVAELTGWAADPAGARPPSSVIVFAGSRLVARVRPDIPRPDVSRTLGVPEVRTYGYVLAFPLPAVGESVRVFAIAGGRAAELSYLPHYPWRT